MSPQLAILLKMKFNILSVGNCRVNRKGWPRNELNMTKLSTRVEYKILYDNVNQICCIQWRDTKVVNLVSKLLLSYSIHFLANLYGWHGKLRQIKC